MLAAFFESTKFVAHLLPVSFMRIFLGYVYLQQALNHITLGWLDKPILSSKLSSILPSVEMGDWLRWVVENLAVPYWLEVSFVLIAFEFAIAISYLAGYLVRPIAVIAAILVWLQLPLAATGEVLLLKILLVLHIFLSWIGAGRVLGFDYYFYKKQRGLWW